MIRAMFLGTVGIVVACLLYVAYYTGYFKEVRIETGKAGPFLVLAKEHFGPYHEVVPKIEAVETWVKGKAADCTRSFGQYFDDPQTTESARLKSRGGCIMVAKIEVIPDDFKYDEIPEQNYVKAIFEGAPGIGPMKVYPKVEKYVREHGLKPKPGVLEIYVIHGQTAMTTTYYFPVE